MMNVPPEEVRHMSLWEYEALLFHWNEAHSLDGGPDAPDPEVAMRILKRANDTPALVH